MIALTFPLVVAINDILTQEPIFIENGDPELLVSEFIAELTQRQELILSKVWNMYPLVDADFLPKQVRERWRDWVNQVPVL